MNSKKGGIHFIKTTVIGGLVFLVPVVATFGGAARVGLEIERLDDGRVVVMVQRSPNPWSGEVHIMAPESVKPLDLPMTAYMENIERFGQGTNEMLRSLVHSQTLKEDGSNENDSSNSDRVCCGARARRAGNGARRR